MNKLPLTLFFATSFLLSPTHAEEKETVITFTAQYDAQLLDLRFNEDMFDPKDAAPEAPKLRLEPHNPCESLWLNPRRVLIFPQKEIKYQDKYNLFLPEHLQTKEGKKATPRLAWEATSYTRSGSITQPAWTPRVGILRDSHLKEGQYRLMLSLPFPLSESELPEFISSLKWSYTHEDKEIVISPIHWKNPASPEEGIEEHRGLKLSWNKDDRKCFPSELQAQLQASHSFLYFDLELLQEENDAGELFRPLAGIKLLCQGQKPEPFHYESFVLTPRPPVLKFDFLRKYTSTTANKHLGSWRSSTIQEARITIWKAQEERRPQLLHEYSSLEEKAEQKQLFISEKTKEALELYGEYSPSAPPVITKPGMYLIEAQALPTQEWLEVSPKRSEARLQLQALLQVSDIRAHWAYTPTGIRMILTDAKSNLPIKEGQVRGLDASGQCLAEAEIINGFAELKLESELQSKLYYFEAKSGEDMLTIKKSEVLWKFPYTQEESYLRFLDANTHRGMLQLEQAQYGLADKVRLMGMIRRVDNEKQELQLPDSKETFYLYLNRHAKPNFRVEHWHRKTLDMIKYPVQVDEHGCFELEFDAAELGLGTHELILFGSEILAAQSLSIEESMDNTLELSSTIKEGRFELKLKASDTNLLNAQAKLSLERTRFTFHTSEFPFYFFGPEESIGHKVKKLSNERAEFPLFHDGMTETISLESPAHEDEILTEKYCASLEIQQSDGSTLTRSIEGLIHPAKAYIGLRYERYDQKLYLQLVDCEGKELKEDAEVKVNIISYRPQDQRQSDGLYHTTLKAGKAVLSLENLDHDYYFARAQGQDKEGKSYVSELSLTAPEHNDLPPQPNSSVAQLGIETYQVEDEVCLLLEPRQAGQIYITLESQGRVIKHWNEAYAADQTELRFNIPQGTAHALKAHVLYLGDELHAMERSFQIKAAEHQLHIDLETTTAGEQTSMSGRVLDSEGKAASKAQVLLMVVEDAALSAGSLKAENPLKQMHFYITRSLTWEKMEERFGNRNEARLFNSGPLYPWTENIGLGSYGDGFGSGGRSGGGWYSYPATPLKHAYASPTLLWKPRLACDSEGRFSATFRTPNNGKAYRIIAIACAGAEDFGKAEAKLSIQAEEEKTIP